MLQRAQNTRPQRTSSEVFPAPTKGWVQSGNIVTAGPDQAEVLDNFIPTAQGARLRGGCTEYADIGSAVVRLFSYTSGSTADLFGSTASGIYDVDRVASGGSNAFADVEGLTSGDWSAHQMTTPAGQFLVVVNGADAMHYWNGTAWNPIVAATVNNLGFDALTTDFAVGETVTGGTSGATASIVSITKSSATAGTLKLGAITGTFQNNEAITSASGAAVVNGTASTASTIAITGVATSDLSQGWVFKERAFFVEEGTTSVWYLSVQSIGGAATELDLGAALRKGGAILFGATWSLDSGAGLDDVCVFVSTEGEIAVYEGTDPSDANAWSRVGVYEIAEPLNKHAWFKAGGDLAILTKDGIIPISEALRKDRAALQASAINYPIEDAWKSAIANATTSYPVSASLWQSRALLLIGTPATDNNRNVSFIANARTGAWARVTGWDVRTSAVADDVLYFATEGGIVLRADQGGSDNGVAYVGEYVPKFSNSMQWRDAMATSITYRASSQVQFGLFAHGDYRVDTMQAPQQENVDQGDVWGTGVWGTFVWGGANSSLNTYTEWQSSRARGYALSPGVVIASNQTSPIIFEILATRIRFEVGTSP